MCLFVLSIMVDNECKSAFLNFLKFTFFHNNTFVTNCNDSTCKILMRKVMFKSKCIFKNFRLLHWMWLLCFADLILSLSFLEHLYKLWKSLRPKTKKFLKRILSHISPFMKEQKRKKKELLFLSRKFNSKTDINNGLRQRESFKSFFLLFGEKSKK